MGNAITKFLNLKGDGIVIKNLSASSNTNTITLKNRLLNTTVHTTNIGRHFRDLMDTYSYAEKLFEMDSSLKAIRRMKEKYIRLYDSSRSTQAARLLPF